MPLRQNDVLAIEVLDNLLSDPVGHEDVRARMCLRSNTLVTHPQPRIGSSVVGGDDCDAHVARDPFEEA